MKQIQLVLFLLFAAFLVNGQTNIKFAAGLNFTNLTGNSTSNFKAQAGYQFGGSVSVGKKFYFEPGLYFLHKSSQLVSASTSLPVVNYDLSGFRIPMNVGLHLLGNAKSTIALRAFGGLSAFILTSAKDISIDDFKKATFGAQAGVGANLSIFFAEASYEWSLSNISTDLAAIDLGKSRALFIHSGVRIKF